MGAEFLPPKSGHRREKQPVLAGNFDQFDIFRDTDSSNQEGFANTHHIRLAWTTKWWMSETSQKL